MSREIDERIVQMRLDSAQFERNAQASTKSLDALKKGLNFEDATKGFEELDKASKGLKFDGLVAGVEALNNRFTLLGITGLRIMDRIANAAIDAGEKMVRSLSVDQIEQGWEKYANKTSAVQTIMAATANQYSDTATQMADVNTQLAKLNWYTDETSYNFVDMVSNIGKFTSNNIELDKSVTAMQGIANWAAISGANANSASRAMYNLSQALATGKIRVIDWMSIENANMATAGFKEAVIEAALETGTLVKQGDAIVTAAKKTKVSVESFRDTLAEDWFTSDVLMNALNKYGKASDRLYEIVDMTGITTSSLIGYINEYTDGTLDLSKASKELGLSVDKTKAIMEEFQDETMQFGLKAFAAGQEAKTFAEAIESVKDAVSSGWMTTFEHIFGDYEQAKKLWTNVANVLYELFAESGNARNELLEGWAELGGRSHVLAILYNLIAAIVKVLNQVKFAWASIFPPKTAEDLYNITERLALFSQKLIISDENAEKLQRTFAGLFAVVDILKTVFTGALSKGLSLFGVATENINFNILDITAHIGDLLVKFDEWVHTETILNDAIDSGIFRIRAFISSLTSFFNSINSKNVSNIANGINTISESFKGLDENTIFLIGLGSAVAFVAAKVYTHIRNLKNSVSGFSGAITGIVESVKNVGLAFDGIAKLTKAGSKYMQSKAILNMAISIGILTASLYALSKIEPQRLFDSALILGLLAGGLVAVSIAMSKFTLSLKGSASMIGLALAVAALVATLNSIDTKEAWTKVGILTLIMAELVGVSILIQKLGGSFTKGSASMIGLALAVAALVATLNSIDTKEAWTKVGILTLIMAELVGVSILIQKLGGSFTKGSASMIGLAVAIKIMVSAFNDIQKLSLEALLSGVIKLGVVIASLGGVMYALGKLKGSTIKASTTLVLLSVAINLMVPAVKSLAKLSASDIANALVALTGVGIVFALVVASTKYAGEHAARAGVTLLGMALAIDMIQLAILSMSRMDPDKLDNAVGVIMKLMATFSLIIVATKYAGKVDPSIAIILAIIAGLGLIVYGLSKIDNVDNALKSTNAVSLLMASMSGMLLALSGVTAILSKVHTNLASVTKGAAAIDILIVIVGGFIALLGALDELTSGGLTNALNNGRDVLIAIGEAIGGFIGGLVGGLAGGLLEGISSVWPSVCQNLSAGMVNLVPFFETLEMIPGGGLELIGTLLGMILALTAAEFVSGLKAIPGIGQLLSIGMLSLPADFASFGFALRSFADALGDVDATRVKNAAEAVSLLATLESSLPGQGGKLQQWLGEKSLSSFGERLKLFGSAIADFVASLGDGIDSSKVEAAASAGMLLANLESSIPAHGGKLQDWIGDKGLDTFGNRIQLFGKAIKAYADEVAGLNVNAIEESATAGQMLVSLENGLNAVPVEGSIKEWFFGTASLDTFGERIVSFATAIKDYANTVHGVTYADVESSVAAAQLLSSLESTLGETGGVKAWWAGDNSLKSFGDNIRVLGESLSDYAYEISSIDFVKVNAVPEYLERLGSLGYVYESMKSLVSNVDSMCSEIISLLRNRSNDCKISGNNMASYMVDGIVLGITANIDRAKAATSKLARAIITRFEQEMDINSPSVVMAEEGEYVVMGVAEGIKKNTSAEDAATKKAQNIISAFQTVFDNADLKINYGKAEFENWKTTVGRGAGWKEVLEQDLKNKKNELEAIGEKVKASYAKWLSLQQSGADEKTIREAEIAYIEMSNSYQSLRNDIIDAQIESAESMIEELDLLDQVRQAEYDRWASTKEGKNASAAEKTTKEMELLVSQLETVADTTAILWAKHREMVNEFGEDSTEARNAYIKALNSEQKLNETYDSIMEKQKGSFDSIKEARDSAILAYSDFMNDIAPKLMEMGFTMDQVEAQAKRESNWDQYWGNNVAGEIKQSDLDAIMEKAKAPIDLVKENLIETIGEETIDTISVKLMDGIPLAITKSAPKAAKASKELGENANEALNETYPDWENTGENLVNGIIKGMGNRSSALETAAEEMMFGVLGATNAAAGVESPSKKTYQTGVYLVEGLISALHQNGSRVEAAGEDMSENVLTGVSSLTQNLTSLLQDNIDLDPVITPVLDMDEIIAQSKDIPGILNANNGLDVSSIDIQANRVSASLKKTGTIPDPDNQNESSGTTYNFTQNNYSPKALSRYDIYRQTRNQISQLKGATSK